MVRALIVCVLLAGCGGESDGPPTQEQIEIGCNQWCACDAAAPFPDPDCYETCPETGGPFAACAAGQLEDFTDCVETAFDCGRCLYETGCGDPDAPQ